MNTFRHTPSTNLVLKNPDDNIHHGDRAIKLVLAAMICLGVVALPALADTNDQPKVTTSAVAQAYQIPSGMLRNALKRFAKQAGITLYFKGVNLQGVTTQGLSGNYTTKDGLDRLLAEAGLYAVPKGKGYLIQKVSPAVVASNPTPNLTPIESQVVVPSAKPIEKETTLPVASNSTPNLAPIESQVVVPVVSSAKPIEKETALPVASMPSPSPSLVEKEAVLPTVSVSATSAKNVDGYTVKRISSATKTDTLLRDIPQSVSVVTQDMIQDQSMKSMAEVVRYVPGVGMSQGEGNNDSPIFRGNQSSADFYVDGIRDDVQYFRDLYNMERVDVLKGPSGMIFGRGSSGGIINRVTKEAGWDPVREVTVQGGSFNTKRVMLDVGQGVNEVVAVRLNAMYENSGSYRDDVTVKRQGISPTVTILPDARTKIVVGAEVFQDNRTVDRGVPSYNGLPLSTSRSTVFGNPALSPAETDVKSLNSLFEHEFDDKIVVRNRNRLAVYDNSYQNIYAVGPYDPASHTGVGVSQSGTGYNSGAGIEMAAYRSETKRVNFFNQTDLLYKVSTGSVEHELLTGIEVGIQNTNNLRKVGYFGLDAYKVDPDAHPDDPEEDHVASSRFVTPGSPRTTDNVAFRLDSYGISHHTTAKTTGLYLQDQVKLLPNLQALLGVRYDRFELDFHNNRTGEELQTTNNLLSPRAGLVYKPIEPVSIYTSYSLAYVPRAGDQLAGLEVSNKALAPEKFTNREVGAKWDIRPRLALTAAAYQLDRTNVIVTSGATSSFLAKGQSTKGVELGVSGKITSAWSTSGGYAYQEGKISGAQEGAAVGATLGQLPTHTLSLWNKYNFTPMFGAGLGVINRSNMFTTADNTVNLPGYTRLDGALYAKIDKNLRLQMNIENVLNRHYFSAASNNNNITPGSPIAIRISIISNF